MKKRTIQKIGLFANSDKKDALRLAEKLITWVIKQKKEIILDSALAKKIKLSDKIKSKIKSKIDSADLLIVIGGDGTLLSAARNTKNKKIPLLGINFGKLGFLTETTSDNIYPFLRQVFQGEYYIEHRSRLKANITRKKEIIPTTEALNDFVVSKSTLARTLKLDLVINGDFVTNYVVDGLIISTPTGSTAYSLSAGGPIVYPETGGTIITPICPHTLSNRPLVIPDRSVVEIVVASKIEKTSLTADGQSLWDLQYKDRITISRAKTDIGLVMPLQKSHFATLRDKLRWMGQF